MYVTTKYLEKLKNEQLLAEFYTDRYGESDYGFLLDYTDEFIAIEKFDNKCNYEGIVIFFRKNVSRIRWSGNELETVFMLIDSSQRKHQTLNLNLTSIQNALNSVFQIYQHITIHIQDVEKDVCFIGQIQDIDDQSIVIREYGTKSTLDRKYILLSVEDITKIEADGQYERNLKRLFKD